MLVLAAIADGMRVGDELDRGGAGIEALQNRGRYNKTLHLTWRQWDTRTAVVGRHGTWWWQQQPGWMQSIYGDGSSSVSKQQTWTVRIESTELERSAPRPDRAL